MEDMFPESLDLNGSAKNGEFSKGNPVASDYFGNPASDESKIKSCLIINWEKKTYTEKGNNDSHKWSGVFTWTWSFINDNKGFIVVGISTSGAGQLNLTGGAYLLEKQNDSNWLVKYQKETSSMVTNEKRFTDTTFDDRFPKVKAGSGVSIGSGDFWGFASGNSDVENVLAESDAADKSIKATKTELEEFKWTSKNSVDNKISEWTGNWGWWEAIAGKNGFGLETSLEKFKGTWTKVGG